MKNEDFNGLLQGVKTYLYEDEKLIKLPKKKSLNKKKIAERATDYLVKPEVKIELPIVSISESKVKIQESQFPLNSLEHLMQKIRSCHLCSLSRTRNNVVAGSGKPKSMLYIIGEGPGQEEDLQGAPFVGRSGQLLTKMLEAIAIDRQDIFITNIVKCRPPNNRDPLEEEIKACTPYLKQQIELGKPKVLLALGRYSTGFLLNDFKSSLASFRGVLHESDYGKVVVTYHPAAVLRSPNQRRPMVWEDLKFLAQYLHQCGFYNQEQIQILTNNKVLENF